MRRPGLVVALAGLTLATVGPSASAAPSIPFTTTQLDASAPVNRTVGWLKVRRTTGKTDICTAAVVDAPNRSTIVTAGHCVVNAIEGSVTGAVFTPGLQGGSAPFGSWDVRQLNPPAGWVSAFDTQYDFAFGVIARNTGGQAVEDVVGGLPIAFNQVRQQPYTALGYPDSPAPPYDGTHLWECQSSTEVDDTPAPPDPTRMSIGCDFEHGSSGGPWLSSDGKVASVTSTGVPGIPVLSGPYFGDAAAALYGAVGNVSTVMVASHRRCRKHHNGRAASAKKRCRKRGRR